MDTALDLLKTDHKKVRDLLDDLAATTERAAKSRADLLNQVALELRAHGAIEEEIFYPALREAGAADKDVTRMVAEAYEEHRAAVQLVLADVEKTAPASVEFSGRVKVLKELIEHHADEEEKEMFKAARKLFTKEELVELGGQMEARKAELLAGGKPAAARRRTPGKQTPGASETASS